MILRPRHLVPTLLASAMALLAPPLAAQTPAERAALSAWQARVESIRDPDQLAPLLAVPDSAARDRTVRLLGTLRRGFTRYRLGQLTHNRRYYDDALDDFWSVIEERYQWPVAWYALGLTKVSMAREDLAPYEQIHQQPGYSYADEAREALNRALEYDEDYVAPRVALEILERGAHAVMERDPGLVLLGQARERFGRGDTAGGMLAYRAAAARASSRLARERLRADLAWIADSAELRRFDGTHAKNLPAWLEAFWERRDVRDLRRPGERLVEHYRRLLYAEEHFVRLGSPMPSLHFERSPEGDRPLDDRAVIFIRHGEPHERAAFNSPFGSAEMLAPQEDGIPEGTDLPTRPEDRVPPVPPNLSWKYERPEGDLIFHFVARYGHHYRLVESLLDVFSLDTVIKLQMGGPVGEVAGPAWESARFAKALVASRSELDPLYARLANRLTLQGAGDLQRERATGQESLEIGTTTDSYRDTYPEALEPVIQVYGLARGEDGKVLVVIGVPPGRPATAALDVRVVISTADDRRLVQVDTALHLDSPADSGRRGGLVELPAPDGTHRVRVVAVDEARQAAGDATIEDVVVPARPGPPAVSDLVLGRRGDLSWYAADGVVWLDSDGDFAPGSTAQLYYQVSDLTPGTTYRTRIELRRAGDRQRIRRITSAFDMVATGTIQAERRELSLAGLRPGDYVLELTLAGPSGTVTRSRMLRVR
ncbi:MAG: hypothetical protein ACREM9_15440 [Gemmatimonadales bacterium]